MSNAGTRVRAYHLIITTYGFWLPNDPRGSWSTVVRAFELRRFGPATKTNERRSVAYEAHDRKLRFAAKRSLTRAPVRFTGVQARAVARGFGRSVERSGFVIHACAVMPDHAHLVIARHTYPIERIATQLKANATAQLVAENLHPFQHALYTDGTRPTPWARKQWAVFLFDDKAITRAIQYVNQNPTRASFNPQHWTFVTPV